MSDLGNISKRVSCAMLESMEKMDFDTLSGLWADDATQEMPFAPAGFPRRFEGKAELDVQYKRLLGQFVHARFPVKRISVLEDPEWVMIEFEGFIRFVDGTEYNNQYISLFQVHDGKIALFREYFDPNILSDAFDKNLKSTLIPESRHHQPLTRANKTGSRLATPLRRNSL